MTKVSPFLPIAQGETHRSETALTTSQSQIEDLQYLSEQYEQQEAERMIRASGAMNATDLYINQPIPVQQRARNR